MATTENRTRTTNSDDAAIAELHEIVERQRGAFLADPFPSLEERQGLLGALAAMLIGHRTEIHEAMSSDLPSPVHLCRRLFTFPPSVSRFRPVPSARTT